jgi:hypothetical protein
MVSGAGRVEWHYLRLSVLSWLLKGSAAATMARYDALTCQWIHDHAQEIPGHLTRTLTWLCSIFMLSAPLLPHAADLLNSVGGGGRPGRTRDALQHLLPVICG